MYASNVVLNVVLVEYSPSRIFDCMVYGAIFGLISIVEQAVSHCQRDKVAFV